jgi:hypothetical protein
MQQEPQERAAGPGQVRHAPGCASRLPRSWTERPRLRGRTVWSRRSCWRRSPVMSLAAKAPPRQRAVPIILAEIDWKCQAFT